jgi:hypothetical protein
MHHPSGLPFVVVEDLGNARQPLPNMEAIYFLTPHEAVVDRFLVDFGKQPMYAAAHLFFSDRMPSLTL